MNGFESLLQGVGAFGVCACNLGVLLAAVCIGTLGRRREVGFDWCTAWGAVALAGWALAVPTALLFSIQGGAQDHDRYYRQGWVILQKDGGARELVSPEAYARFLRDSERLDCPIPYRVDRLDARAGFEHTVCQALNVWTLRGAAGLFGALIVPAPALALLWLLGMLWMLLALCLSALASLFG